MVKGTHKLRQEGDRLQEPVEGMASALPASDPISNARTLVMDQTNDLVLSLQALRVLTPDRAHQGNVVGALRISPRHLRDTSRLVLEYEGDQLLSPVRRVLEAAYLTPAELQHDSRVREPSAIMPTHRQLYAQVPPSYVEDS